MTLTLQERAARQANPIGRRLFLLMEAKQTNLAISADVTTQQELIDIAATLGPKICLLKTHLDILTDADNKLTTRLQSLATQHNFLLFEDRKFADIGNTVKLQYTGGPHQISQWADIVNFHLLPGPGILDALRSSPSKAERGFLVISQMSSQNNLLNAGYAQQTVKLAAANPDDVIGFICTQQQSNDPRFLHLTPGIKMNIDQDSLGQQYRTPQQAIVQQGCDIIIVGRGVINETKMLAAAEQYREAGWRAYLQTIKENIS